MSMMQPLAKSPVLDPRLMAAAKQGPVDAIVFFNQSSKPGLSSALAALDAAEAMPLGSERKQLAYNSLREIGTETLNAKMPLLDKLTAAGQVSAVDALWSFNAVRVRGASIDALTTLAGADVRQIVQDEIVAAPTLPSSLDDSVHGASMIPMGKAQSASALPTDTPEDPTKVYIDWGTKKMDAPAAWAQGITGAGIVVASLDTGVISDHPGLKANYRGTQADGTVDHNYNLLNVVEKGAAYPIDDVGHGTHTIGSTLGNDAHHLVGVAPDAKFIQARGLGEKGGSMFSLMAAMEWMLAPTDLAGKNPKPELAPDIVTNSWGGGTTSQPFLWQALRNWRRSGIVPVFASGNDRKASPGRVSAPGMYAETITVGATEPDDKRAYFSMYGPSDFSKDHKPEVGAPGTWTYSTYPDGTYRDTFVIDGKAHPASGTSMATPHVAGAVALYMQAHPKASYEDVLGALKASGTQFTAPDEELGYGRVQVNKLIAPGTIDPSAKLADPTRVAQLMDQVAKAEIFSTRPAPAPATPPATPEPAKVPALAAH